MLSSSVEPDNGLAPAAAASVVPSKPAIDDERLVSSLRTQAEVDMLCKKHGVPSVYTPRPAGDDRRAFTPPPPGSVCVYALALEAGMRVPLDGFFCEVLAHYAIAPAQLVPNGWRVMAGFLGLCRSVGVPPSLAVFRRFFLLAIVNSKFNGWYCFRTRDSSVLRFTGMPNTPMDWKKLFFFLLSPEPWPCPVEWGEPSKSSFLEPVLIGEEKKWEAKLLGSYGGSVAVDIKTCLCDGNLAGAVVTTASPPPPPASTCSTPSSKGMDPSVYHMMKTMLAEKAAAQASASAKKVKAEPGSNVPGSPPLCGSKRSLEQAKGEKGPCPSPSVLPNTPLSGVCSPAPGFSPKPQHLPSRHGGDNTDWEAARDLLQGAVAPQQELAFAASEPSDVVRSSHAVILQAVNYTTFSLSYLLELEKKLVARDAEVAALREQLEEAKAELAAAKRPGQAGEAERESAEAAALQHLLATEEHVRRRAGQALQRYERWRDDSSAHATASPTATSSPTAQPMMHPNGRHKRRPEPSTKYDPKQWVL